MTDLGAITNIQADIQKVLKPGVWLPLLRRPHNYGESWSMDADVATFIEDVKKSVKALETTTHDDGSVYKLSDATTDHIVVACFTKSRWMDLVEIKATSKGGKTTASVFGYSTGFLPLSIPGAALLNPFLCWFPFDDFEKPKLVWLPAIRKGMTVEVTVEEKGRQW